MSKNVFISYSRMDFERVKAIKEDIERITGADCWMDLEGIESGSPSFTDEIIAAINSCPVFLFMLSENSQQSENACKELHFAYTKRVNAGRHVVIVYIEDCEMDDSLKFDYQKADTIAWDNPYQREKLIRDLKRWSNSNREIAPAEALTFKSDKQGQSSRKPSGRKWFIPALITLLAVAAAAYGLLGRHGAETSVGTDDYSKTYSEQLQKAAEAGDALAQFYLGLALENGYGIVANAHDAVTWYTKAAEQGMDSAQVNLALCYLEGKGVTENETEGVRWLKSAIEQGNADAMLAYGLYLSEYCGDTEAGEEWLRKAEESGSQKVQTALRKIGKQE